MVSTDVNTVTYNGDGSTTAFPFTFKIQDAGEINLQLVQDDDTVTDITSDFYVDTVNSTVYYPGYAPGAEPPEADQPPKVQTGQKLTIWRDVPMTQENDLGDKWPFKEIENGLDKLTMICQQIYAYTNRKLDAALASMFQLAGIVTDSDKLQHITDQYNAIDANAAAAAESEGNAAASATAAASSASSASASNTSATNTANALITFLNGKETLTAPAVDATLAITGAAADARMTGQKFVRITETTKNMFNPDALVLMAGWTEDNGVYSGKALYLDRNFRQGLGHYPVSGFKANTQYTFSLDGYTDGNEGTTGGGVHVYFYYTDSSFSSAFLLLNSATSYTRGKGTSQANKTIDTIKISYGGLPNNIWHLKNIQLEEGTSVTDFVPHRIAVDTVAREAIDTINENIEPVVPYFYKRTKIADFSNATIGATYPYVRMYGLSIPPDATTKIDVVSSDDSDTNNLYFNLYSNGTRLTPVGILNGYGTRTVSLTNTYGAEITEIDAVLVKVNELNSYNITFYVGDYLPNAVDDLEAKVDALIDGDSVIPSYYETHLANAISSAQTNIANAGITGESFVFISDIHWENNEKNSPTLIKEITKKLPIANTFFGGDAFNGGTQSAKITDMNDIREKFTKASPHFLSVFGNHDDDQLDGGTQFSHKEFYTFLQKQADYYVKYEAPCYYYMDNEATKTRFIVLDTGTGTPPTANAQLTWLNNVINSAPTGYHFIVFAHVIFYPQSGGSYSDPTTWVMSPFMTNVCSALDTAKGNGKDVEAVFGGHCHYDWNTTTTGGIPIVLIDCDTKQTASGNPQAAGTINEQAFDIVTVDYSSSTIYCTRVGRGNNRTITY